ncbi:MAG: DNA repair protein RecO (recombination protein O) [Candidatus Berkelbacteria bacterium Licking1014_96]|uniref:DNA repair protein RecO n=1 Tax=Candidatus Berkelbacteria bacterium Licking1014_96 TaxID=2017149 RepID=A0A554LEG2_9BACT|nr:MAG: DNA repair protein RecO (recombination protein O) [Candidatus Berkelbacteria bacterium Licking1014_96]
MNRSYKTKAIIIKQYEVGEADRIVVVFSREFGRLVLKARGVRKILAKLKGHLELLAYTQLEIHQGRSLDTIIGAEAQSLFKKIRQNLRSTSRLYLVLEFLNKILPEGEPHPEIFDRLLYLLENLDKKESRERRIVVITYFCLQVLRELGYYPHFRECLKCQKDIESGGNFFDFLGAGIVCRDCGGEEALMPVSDQAVIFLRFLIENNNIFLPEIKVLPKVSVEAYSLVERYLETTIDSELKSKKFVKLVD